MYACELQPYLGPVRPARLSSSTKSCDWISLFFLGQQIQSHLQTNGLHVVLTESWCHVHVHLQKPSCKYPNVRLVKAVLILCHLHRLLLPSGSTSAWSISSFVRRLTNHSKDFWSRLIQMKSTCRQTKQIYVKSLWNQDAIVNTLTICYKHIIISSYRKKNKSVRHFSCPTKYPSSS